MKSHERGIVVVFLWNIKLKEKITLMHLNEREDYSFAEMGLKEGLFWRNVIKKGITLVENKSTRQYERLAKKRK